MSSVKKTHEAHQQPEHHHEAPHPGQSDQDTLQKAKTMEDQAKHREQNHKLPPKRGDSSDRSFGT